MSPDKAWRRESMSNSFKRFLFLETFMLAFLASGTRAQSVFVPFGPPPSARQVILARPSSRHVWLPGYYRWHGKRYVWGMATGQFHLVRERCGCRAPGNRAGEDTFGSAVIGGRSAQRGYFADNSVASTAGQPDTDYCDFCCGKRRHSPPFLPELPSTVYLASFIAR
jgi:hypothetical protein